MDSDNKTTSQGSSVGSLLSTVMQELSSLVRNEAALAKTEMSEKNHQAMAAIAAIAIAGAVLFGGFLALLAAAIFLLNEVLPPRYHAMAIGGHCRRGSDVNWLHYVDGRA